MDRGYYDFAFWAALDRAGCRFVTRLKSHSPTRLVEERAACTGERILADRIVRLSQRLQAPARQSLPAARCARSRSGATTARRCDWSPTISSARPQRIAELYKARWQIELFFKWIKQNLKIKRFLGTSENAVTLQIVTALIAYLLIHYAHRLSHAPASRQRFRQLRAGQLVATPAASRTARLTQAATSMAHAPTRPRPAMTAGTGQQWARPEGGTKAGSYVWRELSGVMSGD